MQTYGDKADSGKCQNSLRTEGSENQMCSIIVKYNMILIIKILSGALELSKYH